MKAGKSQDCSLENQKAQRILSVYEYLKGRCRDRTRLLSAIPSPRTRCSGHKREHMVRSPWIQGSTSMLCGAPAQVVQRCCTVSSLEVFKGHHTWALGAHLSRAWTRWTQRATHQLQPSCEQLLRIATPLLPCMLTTLEATWFISQNTHNHMLKFSHKGIRLELPLCGWDPNQFLVSPLQT